MSTAGGAGGASDASDTEKMALTQLALYGWRCLKIHRDAQSDIDGFELHDMAVACGLLESRTVTEPCGESCTCESVDFPTQCYFMTSAVRELGQKLKPD